MFRSFNKFSRSLNEKIAPKNKRRRKMYSSLSTFEALEPRQMLTTFTVTNLSDSGAGSLRDAISQANVNPGQDNIIFAPELANQTININDALVVTDHQVTIAGNGVTINANGNSRVFEIDADFPSQNQTTEIRNFTITGGSTDGDGGGILTNTRTSLQFVNVLNNSAGTNGGGVAAISDLANDPVLLIVNESNVNNNNAGNNGGGIEGEIVQVSNTDIINNDAGLVGGGVAGFDVKIMDSVVSDNNAETSGGGIDARFAELCDTTLRNNTAGTDGGGINSNNGNVMVTENSQIIDNTANSGGGIATFEGEVTISDSTISGNSATGLGGFSQGRGGGGTFLFTIASIIRSFIVNNTSTNAGAGISLNFGSNAIVVDTSISGNSTGETGGGVDIDKDSSASFTGGNVSGNTAMDNGGGANAEASESSFFIGPVAPRVSFDGTIFENNVSQEEGGGLFLGENMFTPITNATFRGNSAEDGGAIFAARDADAATLTSQLTITGSTFDNNLAQFEGGALEINQNHDVTISDTTFVSNTAFGEQFNQPRGFGGAIDIDNADLDCDSCTFENNEARRNGGAIRTRNTVNLNITDSEFRNNVANDGGAINASSANSNLSINRTTIDGNQSNFGAGGIELDGDLVLQDSTVSRNTSKNGIGGINVDGTSSSATIANTTLAQNSGASTGGIEINQFANDVSIQSTTIAENFSANDGGGINVLTGGDVNVEIRNSIVADNSAAGIGNDIVGELLADFTLVEDVFGSVLNGTDNITGIDPELGPLADNGGPTETMLLASTSVAINAGDPTAIAGQNGVPEFDQRGEARIADGRMDLGAVESQMDLLLGDVNQDGLVNLLDIDPFVELLSSSLFQAEADMNQDGVVNLLDIDPFVDALSG